MFPLYFQSFFAILFTCFFALSSQNLESAIPKLHEKLGGKNLEILQRPKHVTILTLIPEHAKEHYGTSHEIHLNQEEIARLQRNLLDDHNYDFEKENNCLFHAEISFKFIDDRGEVLHVFVSPVCNQILFGMGKKSVLLNYDPSQQRLEHFFQQIVSETKRRNESQWNI